MRKLVRLCICGVAGGMLELRIPLVRIVLNILIGRVNGKKRETVPILAAVKLPVAEVGRVTNFINASRCVAFSTLTFWFIASIPETHGNSKLRMTYSARL